LGISITVSEVPCSQSSFSGQSLVGITDAHSKVDVMVADVVDSAVTTSAVQSTASAASRVPSPAAAAGSTGMTPTVLPSNEVPCSPVSLVGTESVETMPLVVVAGADDNLVAHCRGLEDDMVTVWAAQSAEQDAGKLGVDGCSGSDR
jgi:hypothetical protein